MYKRQRQHADAADIDDMALVFLHHARQQPHRHAQAAEIVQVHRALEIVEAVVAALDGAADACLLYTSDAADERSSVDLGGCRTIKKKKNTA